MSKIRLEELESRLLLTSFSLSTHFSLYQPSQTSAGQLYAGGSDGGHAFLVRPAGGDAQTGQAQSPVQNTLFVEFRVNGDPGVGGIGVAPRIVIFDANPAPIAVTINIDPGRLPFSGPGNELNAIPAERTPAIFPTEESNPPPGNEVNAMPVERAQAAFFSAGSNTPPGSGMEILETSPDVLAQVMAASTGPSPVVAASVNPGIISNTGWFQLHSSLSSLGNSSSSESAGQSGAQAQSWLFLPPPALGTAASPPLAELRSLGQDAPLSMLRPYLELGPHGQQAVPLSPPDLAFLKGGLLSLLAVFGPQGQQAIPLPAPDLSALEAGLLQFLAELGDTSAHLAGSREGATLRMWILAAAGAGAACALAYRQQRRTAGVCATEIPQLPGCSLDDVL